MKVLFIRKQSSCQILTLKTWGFGSNKGYLKNIILIKLFFSFSIFCLKNCRKSLILKAFFVVSVIKCKSRCEENFPSWNRVYLSGNHSWRLWNIIFLFWNFEDEKNFLLYYLQPFSYCKIIIIKIWPYSFTSPQII